MLCAIQTKPCATQTKACATQTKACAAQTKACATQTKACAVQIMPNLPSVIRRMAFFDRYKCPATRRANLVIYDQLGFDGRSVFG